VLSRTKDFERGIVVLIRAFDGGGAQRDTVLLCNALAAKGVVPTVLTLHGEGHLRALLDPAIRVIELPGGKLRYAIPGLRRAIRTLAPGVVVASEAALNLCALLAVQMLPPSDRPKLVLREVSSPSVAQHNDPYVQNRIAYRLLRWFYRRADRIVALTEGDRHDLARIFSIPENIISLMRTNAVIPPAIEGRLSQWDGETGRERDLIVCVGRLSPEKDHRTLLRAMTLMPAQRPWRLAIVGDGPERGELEAFVRGNGLAGRVAFIGYSADPFGWLMRARVAVLSSAHEGLPCVLMEALACGTPVVCTDCSYGPRDILQNGRYGLLTPVGDAPALAVAIEAAMDQIPDRGFLMARGLDYTAAKAADRFLEIIADVESPPHGAPAAIEGAA
jgi:glycosyltransferase involved in cell wall biosynthesis